MTSLIKYEATVSGTSFSGNAASLKSHRAWAWWHKQISGYTAPQLSQWATTYRPTDRNGQMTGNTGYTFYGGTGDSVYQPVPKLVGNVSIYVTSPENPETVAEPGDTSTAVVEVSLSSAEKLQEMKDNLKIVGATGGLAEIEVVIKGSKLQGSGANDNFLDEELSKHPLTEINGCTFEKTEEDGKNVCTWKFTLKGLTDSNWYDKTAKTGLIYYMREKSPYKIKFTDTDVTVDDATENKYEVYVKWTVKDAAGAEQSTGYFTPNGQEIDKKEKYTDKGKKKEYIAYDTANWQPGDPITPPPSGEPDVTLPPPSGEPGGEPSGEPDGSPTPVATPAPAGTPTPTPSPTPSPSPTPIPFIPETDEYYSTIEEPYVEIKEGTPGNETFEAMAGVPTTEMLYIGFGATEFLMNLELEHAKSESNEDRLYTLTYTTTKCTEVDAPCTYSCPGHTVTAPGGHMTCTSHGGKYHTHSYCSEGTASGVCSGGQITLTATCSCGQTTVTETFTPTYGSGYTECIGEDGSTDYTGMGCVHTESINTTHPHTHVWISTVKQPIADFDYIDITNLQMWRLSKLSLESEEGLFTTPNVDFDPLTGYQLFYD